MRHHGARVAIVFLEVKWGRIFILSAKLFLNTYHLKNEHLVFINKWQNELSRFFGFDCDVVRRPPARAGDVMEAGSSPEGGLHPVFPTRSRKRAHHF